MRNIKIPGLRNTHSINTLFCIGRNYSEHAKELNNPVPEFPVVFTKPINTLTFDGGEILIPSSLTDDVHHEVEMVVAIGKYGKDIPENEAMSYVCGVGVGIDVTARDVQSVLKSKSHPWTLAKGMDTFAPIGNFREIEDAGNIHDMNIELRINGEVRQQGSTGDMIFSIPALISFLSRYCALNKGDLIFTGTPAGVGKLHQGDEIEAILGDNISSLNVSVKKI
jgi:2-keto-4-pentenoate hydratase/2-oxohepta-3-ene-1,7-dioic acid hydratase in catechol pathway